MKILITSVGGTLAPLSIKFLKSDKQLHNLYIIGIDKCNKIKKNIYLDRFYSIKMDDNRIYIKKLLKICKNEKIELLIPWSDREAILLSKFKKKFLKDKIKILVNDFSVIKNITNKFLTYEILRKAKIKTPKYQLVRNIYELKKGLKKFNYPKKGVVLKPISSVGGRGVKILKSKNSNHEKWIGLGKREQVIKMNKLSISSNLFKYGKLLIMDILQSPAFDVDYFSYNKENISVIRRRINPNGIPYKGNYIIDNKDIQKYCEKISKVLNLKFLTDIDLLCDQNKKTVLLEINPRPSGSVVTAYAARVPILSYAIAKILNKNYTMPLPKLNVKVKL